MVNWMTPSLQDDSTALENVDEEIQILGLKRAVIPFMAQSALASFMFFNPLFFWVGPMILWYLSWRFWEAEKLGRPIEYEPWFKKRLGFKPVFEIFKILPHLKHGESFYR